MKTKRLSSILVVAAVIVGGCKEADSTGSNTTNLVITGDGKGFGGLADLTFEKASGDLCPNGGLLMIVYGDKNSSGSKESSEKVESRYSNCYLDNVAAMEEDRASLKEFKVKSGDVKITNREELKDYWEIAPYHSKAMLNAVVPNADSYETFDDMPFPVKLNEAGVVQFAMFPGVYVWDFALLNVLDVKKLVAYKKEIENFESIKHLKSLEEISLNEVGVTSEHVKSLFALSDLNYISLHRTAVMDPSVLLPFLKRKPSLRLLVDFDELPRLSGPTEIY